MKDEPQIRVQGWAREDQAWSFVFKKGDRSASIAIRGNEEGFEYELRDLTGGKEFEGNLTTSCERDQECFE